MQSRHMYANDEQTNIPLEEEEEITLEVRLLWTSHSIRAC